MKEEINFSGDLLFFGPNTETEQFQISYLRQLLRIEGNDVTEAFKSKYLKDTNDQLYPSLENKLDKIKELLNIFVNFFMSFKNMCIPEYLSSFRKSLTQQEIDDVIVHYEELENTIEIFKAEFNDLFYENALNVLSEYAKVLKKYAVGDASALTETQETELPKAILEAGDNFIGLYFCEHSIINEEFSTSLLEKFPNLREKIDEVKPVLEVGGLIYARYLFLEQNVNGSHYHTNVSVGGHSKPGHLSSVDNALFIVKIIESILKNSFGYEMQFDIPSEQWETLHSPPKVTSL